MSRLSLLNACLAAQGIRFTYPPVVAAYSYDMLGRVTDIDADSSRVDLHYSYVPQEHNIARIRFDHRPGTPYMPNGHDYSANKRSKWLKLPYLAATNHIHLGVNEMKNSVDELTNRYTAIDANSLSHAHAEINGKSKMEN